MSRHPALVLLVLAACASESVMTERTLTDEDARVLAAATSDDDFTVPMNDVVKERLDRWMGERRDFVVATLGRKAGVIGTIDPIIAGHELPNELLAVAFAESGFQDIAARPAEGFPGGGVWQFIAPTARTYGLRVDDTVDERSDLPKETDAAMRLLSDTYGEFGDWALAFAAYNQGSSAVNAAIASEGTDDPWELIRRGALNPYAADVMSAVIVLEQAEALGFSGK